MKNIKNKNITILGAVRSGIAAAKLAKQMGAIPFLSDNAHVTDGINKLDDEGILYEIGGHSDKVFDCDFIVTSPGVPSNSNVLVEAKSLGIKIYSEIEFASWFCKGKIIAITGSNGKTTTTTLCAHVLNNCGIKTYLAGNIGVAFSESVLDVKEEEYVALEVSSFQLDFIDSFKPNYAVIINITPDHLDRYEYDFTKYSSAKLGINKNQHDDDYLILNYDDKLLASSDFKNGEKITFSLNNNMASIHISNNEFVSNIRNGKEIICNTSDLQIKGSHNQYNAMAVIAIANLLGVENKSLAKALSSFKGVEHRLEFVRNVNGVEFVNDSKATNVDSVWYALQSFNSPIRLILGGKDKGNDYKIIEELVIQHVAKIYAIGSSADKIVEHFDNIVEVQKLANFDDTIQTAFNESNKGEVVLLSPACASFDMFENYEDRGDKFKNIVANL